jgi:hypothetical protein
LSDDRNAIAARLCALLRPRHVMLAGGRDAVLAGILADRAAQVGAVLHVARADTPAWLAALRARHGDACVAHLAAPADAAGVLPVPGLCWVDADPNWFTVGAVLRAVAAQARALGKPLPVILVEGCGWPHGRRDSYDDPAAIPAAARRVHERTGLLPGQAVPAGGMGLQADRVHAVTENEPGNGVLTAVEDFCLEVAEPVRLLVLPAFGGLAALSPASVPDPFGPAALAADALAMAAALETERLAQAVRLQEQADALRRAESLNATLRAALAPAAPPEVPALQQVRRSRVAARVRRAVLLARLAARGELSAWRAAERERLKEEAAAARLRASPAFDAAWYLEQNLDVAAAGEDPVLHYLRNGAAELRDPGPFFSTSYYVEHYPDVAAAGQNPLLHYLISGAVEGRVPAPYFSGSAYLKENSDVAAAGQNPLEHYLARGRAEGRRAPPA